MERDMESEGLVLPMSRSSEAECLNIDDPVVSIGEAVADDAGRAGKEKDLKRKKNVQSRLKGVINNNSQVSKRQRARGARALEGEGLKKRKGGGGGGGEGEGEGGSGGVSWRGSQPAVKKSRRTLEAAPTAPPTSEASLNSSKSEVPREGYHLGAANNQESSDDSEPLINKININAAKRAQIRVKHASLLSENSLSSTCPKNASNLNVPKDFAPHALNSVEISGDSVQTKHNFPGLKDFATKSLRTSKKKGKVSGCEDSVRKDVGNGASAFAFLSKKAPEIEKAVTTEPSSSHVCDNNIEQNLSREVNNSALKWTTHKARQNISGGTANKRARNVLLPRSDNAVSNVVADEQQSLEQNAARTLSSRFSSHGGAFAGNGPGTGQKITEPIVITPASNSVSAENDEGTATQSGGRALRPRKRRQKPNGTKRFREICFNDTDGFQIVNRRIKVFWPLDNKWYCGIVRSYDQRNKLHYVRYDDRDEEWLQLGDEKFKLQFLPGETAGGVKVLEKSQSLSGKAKGKLESKSVSSSQVNNEIPSPPIDNNTLRGRIEHKTFTNFASTLSDASCKSQRNETDCKDGSSLAPLNDHDTKKSAFDSDKKKTEKVYVRRRYRNVGSTGLNEGISKLGKEKASKSETFPAGHEMSSAPSNITCSTESEKNRLCEPVKHDLKHLHSFEKGELMKVNQHGDGVASQIISTSMVCKEISSENGLEYLEDHNNSGMLSETSAGLGNDYQNNNWLELLLRLTDSKGDYQKHDGLQLTSWHFVLSEEVDCGNPFLSCRPILSLLFSGGGLPGVCCHNNLMLRQGGVLMPVWLDVLLEVLVVDDFFGSNLFSFGGSLHEVVIGFSKIVSSFVKPLENQCSCMSLEANILLDFKLPVPSLSFRFSASQGLGNPLDFVFYDFQGITRASWRGLFRKLEVLCFLDKNSSSQSPCNANSWFLQSCSGQMSGMLASSTLVKPRANDLQDMQGRNIHCLDNRVACGPQFQDFIFQDLHQNPSSVGRRGCIVHIESGQGFPPFSLTFSSVPSFFLGLHLKLLLGKPITISDFQSNDSDSSEVGNWEMIDHSEVGGCNAPILEVSLQRTNQAATGSMQIHIERPTDFLESGDHALDSRASLWQTAKLSKVEVDASPISTADGWVMSSPRSSYSELNVTGNAAGLITNQDNHESWVPGNVFRLRRCPTNRSSWRLTGGSSRPRFVHRGVNSRVTDFEEEISFKDGERESTAGQSFQSYFESIHGQPDSKLDRSASFPDTFTAQGNYWSRDKHGMPSSSHLWQDNRIQHAYNGTVEPRKRRSGFSNLIFSENGDGVPFKFRGHMRRGRPSRQNREDKLKKSTDNSLDMVYLDSVSCSANILIVGLDRGWRESGAQVVLEESEHNEWMLSVKLSGVTKYTHKAQQVVQSGSTNRYTHAMIWKGGKDWSLEFPDRKHWALFKEMHEECYNRNLRAASVKHIPIPGVRKIEDYDCGSDSFHFVRPSSRYIRQMESEVEMALATSRVMYDMDSEDEEWLGHLNSSRIADGSCQPGQVSEETFERIMDLLEKAAFTQQRELLNSDEVADFCWDIAPVEVVKAIHAHWQEKRWRKGMALVRHFQPASWERYQQQIKEWESQMNELQNSPTVNKQQLMLERPPMFAFCLKPRGLEVPNKTQKQRSHRKFNAGQQITLRDQENGIFPAIRKQNGISYAEDTSSDALGILQSSSPSEFETFSQPASFNAGSSEATTQIDPMDIRFKINKTYQQKQKMKLTKRKSKKMKICVSSKDQQEGTSHYELDHRKQYVSRGWETSSGDQWNNSPCTPSRYNFSNMNSIHSCAGSELDDEELRVKEATNAARAAAELAALKRARAQRLLQKADLIVHKAAVAVVIAETIQAAERDGQEGSHLDVGNILSEHVDMCRQRVSNLAVTFPRDPRLSENNSVIEESGRAFSGHWRSGMVDPCGIRNDATIRQSPNGSVPASLPSTTCFMTKMKADVMSGTTIGSSSIKGNLDSNQVPETGVDESLLPNDALMPLASWGHEINT